MPINAKVLLGWRGLGLLGSLYAFLGRFPEAEPIHFQSMEALRACLGEQHPDFAGSMGIHAQLYVSLGRLQDAVLLFPQVFVVHATVIARVFSICTDPQRLAFLHGMRSTLDTFLSLVTQYFPHDNSVVRCAFDAVVRLKGLTAEAQMTLRRAILSGRNRIIEKP